MRSIAADHPIITHTMRVENMDCTDCAVQIENAVRLLSGIQKAEVNFATGKLQVTHNPNEVPLQRIIQVISQMGYVVLLEQAGKLPSAVSWWRQPRIALLLIASFLLTIGLAADLLHLGLSEKLIQGLYSAVVIIGGFFPFKNAWTRLQRGSINIHTLLVVATVGAIALNLWEEAALLVIIFSLGEILEAYAVDKARGAIRALVALAPREATVLRAGREVRLPTDQIRVGEIVLVRPGEKVPVDGTVIVGTSAVDQSPITGESIPVEKYPNVEVYAGSINGRGALEIQTTKLVQDTTLARIIHLVEEAQTKKGAAQGFSERFGQVFTPLMFGFATLMGIVPPLLFGQPFSLWFYRALIVLVSSCSCSLVLSVPTAIMAGLSRAARSGVLIKGGVYLENAGQVQVVAFDKTGTLTIGKPVVTDLLPLEGTSETTLLQIAGALESRSEHPLAEAILQSASQAGVALPTIEEFTSITGRGVQGTIAGKSYAVGNPRLFQEFGISLEQHQAAIDELQGQGKTVVIVGNSRHLLGLIAVADQAKANAREAVRRLKQVGVRRVIMLTGDNRVTGEAISHQIGIDEAQTDLLPEDKIAVIRRLQSRYGSVAMVGDGINDAPALAQADVGVAMGVAGTDVALETADVALMTDNLYQLVALIQISRKTAATIRQNIFFSLTTVALLVTAALFGWISLSTALLINEGSALLIIANGLRLLRLKVDFHGN